MICARSMQGADALSAFSINMRLNREGFMLSRMNLKKIVARKDNGAKNLAEATYYGLHISATVSAQGSISTSGNDLFRRCDGL